MNAKAPKPRRRSSTDLRTRAGSGDVNLDVILDVPVTLSMEVGRTRIPIRNLLQLNQGSVVELDRAAGEPLDVFVNGTLVAHGEVVVVNEKFGIRLTDVVSPAERIRKLEVSIGQTLCQAGQSCRHRYSRVCRAACCGATHVSGVSGLRSRSRCRCWSRARGGVRVRLGGAPAARSAVGVGGRDRRPGGHAARARRSAPSCCRSATPQMLIGVAPGRVNTLHVLPEPLELPRRNRPSAPPTSAPCIMPEPRNFKYRA